MLLWSLKGFHFFVFSLYFILPKSFTLSLVASFPLWIEDSKRSVIQVCILLVAVLSIVHQWQRVVVLAQAVGDSWTPAVQTVVIVLWLKVAQDSQGRCCYIQGDILTYLILKPFYHIVLIVVLVDFHYIKLCMYLYLYLNLFHKEKS